MEILDHSVPSLIFYRSLKLENSLHKSILMTQKCKILELLGFAHLGIYFKNSSGIRLGMLVRRRKDGSWKFLSYRRDLGRITCQIVFQTVHEYPVHEFQVFSDQKESGSRPNLTFLEKFKFWAPLLEDAIIGQNVLKNFGRNYALRHVLDSCWLVSESQNQLLLDWWVLLAIWGPSSGLRLFSWFRKVAWARGQNGSAKTTRWSCFVYKTTK